MAGSFSVTVSVVDQATRKFRDINKAFDLVSKPVAQLKSLTNDLGKAFGALESPIAAITGGSVVLGVAAFATQWSRAGENVLNASARIGVATDTLQLLQGAAKRTGVSAESLTSGLRSLGDTLQDALYGRNQQAYEILQKLHIHINRTASGAVDANRAFLDLADAIARVPNPQVQALIARAFGLEELLPILRKGSAGIKELIEAVRKSGAVMSPGAVAAADRFSEALHGLGDAVAGVGNAIGEKLIPVLDPAVRGLTKWIEVHKAASAELGLIGGGAATAGGLALLSKAPVIGGLLGAVGLGTGAAAGIGLGTMAGATAASLMEGNRGLSGGMTLDPEGGLVMMPVASPRSAAENGKVTIEIRTPPGTTARPTWEGSLIDDVKVENSTPVTRP